MKHRTAHPAARSRQARFLYADDTAIARCLRGKIAGKAEQIVGRTRLISRCSLRHLRRTGLSRHFKRSRTGLLSQALTHHMFQDCLYLFERFRLANLLITLHHLGWKLHERLAVLHHLFHKSRTHHAAVVGNGVIKGECGDGRNLRFIADAHPRKGRIAPVEPLPVGSPSWHSNLRRGRAHERNSEVQGQASAVNATHKLLRVVVIELVDDATHPDVRTHFQRPWQRNHAISAAPPVVVAHLSSVHRPGSAARIHHVSRVYESVVQSRHDGSHLEHRSRL